MAAPITLSRSQFQQTAAARQPGATYGRYLGYIAKARGGLASAAAPQGASPAPADPYSGIIAGLPRPLTGPQIQTQAQQEISPLVAAVTAQVGKQTQAATHAIGGYAADEAAKLAGMDFTAPYTTGEQGQAAVDAALQQSLSGAGSSDAAALAQRLGVINDPTVAAAAGALSGNGAANGNTQLAQGSAALSNLIANAAAAGSYGQKQPGIAKLAGLQNIAGVQQSGQQNIATQTQALEEQLPSIIQALTGQNDSRQTAIQAAKQNQLARNDQIAAGAATLAERVGATNQTNQTRLQIAKLNAQGKATEDQIRQAESDRAYRLNFSRTYKYDPVTGKPIPGYTRDANGNVVKAGTSTGTKPPTANEINNWVDAFKNGKPVTVRVPTIDPATGKQMTSTTTGAPEWHSETQTSGAKNYQQAYARLRALNVPDTQARQALNTAYQRGEQGRGWLTNEQQSALKTAGRQPAAGRFNGPNGAVHAYLVPAQADALKKAGLLPQGEQGAIKGKPVYWIAPGY